MEAILQPIIKNLRRSYVLLDQLTPAQYSDMSVGPYHSSMGGHLRHILDIFTCIFNGLESLQVDLTARERNESVETDIELMRGYLDKVLHSLDSLKTQSPDTIVAVTDDLGTGLVEVNYTLGSALCQAHSHAIHHFACIGYILDRLGVTIPDERFGYNPTTPEKV